MDAGDGERVDELIAFYPGGDAPRALVGVVVVPELVEQAAMFSLSMMSTMSTGSIMSCSIWTAALSAVRVYRAAVTSAAMEPWPMPCTKS